MRTTCAQRHAAATATDVTFRGMGLPLTLHALAVALALTAAGCSAELPDVDCATPAVPGYAMIDAFTISCNTCHASTLTGASRFGAPPGIDFDTYEAAVLHAEDAARAVFAGDMPPTARLAAADKEVLYRWSLCGTPR
jgi:uncharacterized membrane protein